MPEFDVQSHLSQEGRARGTGPSTLSRLVEQFQGVSCALPGDNDATLGFGSNDMI